MSLVIKQEPKKPHVEPCGQVKFNKKTVAWATESCLPR